MEITLYIASRNGLFHCRGKNGMWSVVDRFLTGRSLTCISFDRGRILAGTRNGVFVTDDGGKSWHESSSGMTIRHIRWMDTQSSKEGVVFAGTEPAGIFVSHDGGDTWVGRKEIEDLRDRLGWYLPYSPEAGCIRGFAFNGDRGYAAAEVGGILRSDDRGETWYLIGEKEGTTRPEGRNSHDVHTMETHPSSPDLVFAVTGGGLFCSKNGGKSWNGLYDCYCRAAWIDGENPDHIIFSPATRKGWHGTVVESMDGGRSWLPASGGLEVPWSGKMIERFSRIGDELFALRSDGMLYTTSLKKIEWSHILPEIDGISAVESGSIIVIKKI